MVSSHPARVVSTISKPDNMLVVNRVVVNTVVSVARNRERETWTKMRKISAPDVPVRIAEARIAN